MSLPGTRPRDPRLRPPTKFDARTRSQYCPRRPHNDRDDGTTSLPPVTMDRAATGSTAVLAERSSGVADSVLRSGLGRVSAGRVPPRSIAWGTTQMELLGVSAQPCDDLPGLGREQSGSTLDSWLCYPSQGPPARVHRRTGTPRAFVRIRSCGPPFAPWTRRRFGPRHHCGAGGTVPTIWRGCPMPARCHDLGAGSKYRCKAVSLVFTRVRESR